MVANILFGPTDKATAEGKAASFRDAGIDVHVGLTGQDQWSVFEGAGLSYSRTYTPPTQTSYNPETGVTTTRVMNVYGEPPNSSYQQAYNENEEQLSKTKANIVYVEKQPVGTLFTIAGRPEPVSRETLLVELKSNEQTLVSNQSQIRVYQSQGYVVDRDAGGNLVFGKQQVSARPVYVDDSAERLRQAQIEYQSLGPAEQFGRALFAGTMFFLQPVYDVLSGAFTEGSKFLASSGSNIYGINPGLGYGAYEGIKKTPENIILRESDIWHSAKSGDVSGFIVKTIQTPTVSDILIPFAGGALAGKALGVVGGIGSGAIKLTGTGANIVQKTASVYPWVAGGIFSGMAVGGVVATGVYEQKGLVKPGSTVEASLRLGVQFTSAGIGAAWSTNLKPVTSVTVDKYGNLVVQKAVTKIGGRPILRYGKPVIVGRTPGGIARVVNLKPSLGAVKWQTAESFMKGTPEWSIPPSWSPDLGLIPNTIYNIPTVGKTSVVPIIFGNKTFLSTGADLGWQPKVVIPKEFSLSTNVLPKPIIYRSYETHFLFVVFEPKPIVSVSIKPNIISFKPKPVVKTAKDIIQSDKQITDVFGGGQTQKGGTVTVQKTETVVEPVQVTRTEQVVSPLSKSIVVPEELLKPVYEYKQEQMTSLLKKPIFQEYVPLQTMKQESIVLLSPMVVSALKKKSISVMMVESAQEKTLAKESILSMVSIFGSAQSQSKGLVFEKGTTSGIKIVSQNDFIYDKINSFVKIVTPFKPESPKPPKPIFDFSDDFMQPKAGGTDAYQVMVKPRQYVDGKRINAGKPYPLSSKAYAEDDAKAIGAAKAGNTAKATFFLKPVNKKPSKRPRSVESWYNVISQYDKKEDGRFVELNRFRINSPGEIKEISMRGWTSHKRRRNR